MGRVAIPGLAAARTKPQFRRSGREQALVEDGAVRGGSPLAGRPHLRTLRSAVAALAIVDAGPLVRVAARALGATAGIALAFLVIFGVSWLRAPGRQRDQARERLSEIDRQRRLLILRTHLEGIREVLHRDIEEGTHKQMSGGVPDGSMSWLEDTNEDLKQKLAALGLPELIPELTLSDSERSERVGGSPAGGTRPARTLVRRPRQRPAVLRRGGQRAAAG
jgi:hypothetical protein